MTLNDPALVVGATAIKNAITHIQLHSGAPGVAGTSNVIGSRVASTGSVDADGDITWTNIAFTGLTANQAVAAATYWTASSGGTWYGSQTLTGDATANSAGEYTITSLTETSTAT
jgi:hypothetical protein